MSALHRLPNEERSKAVGNAFGEAIAASPDGRARVRYRKFDGPVATIVFLVGVAWNPTHSGTQEALVVRQPSSRYVVEMIPFTRLISIDGV